VNSGGVIDSSVNNQERAFVNTIFALSGSRPCPQYTINNHAPSAGCLPACTVHPLRRTAALKRPRHSLRPTGSALSTFLFSKLLRGEFSMVSTHRFSFATCPLIDRRHTKLPRHPRWLSTILTYLCTP
jgi:hypothetical protein